MQLIIVYIILKIMKSKQKLILEYIAKMSKRKIQKALIRKKIKTHLKQKGDNRDFEITPTFIMHWWRLINYAVFNGELKYPENVEIKYWGDGTLGECWSYGNSKLKPVIIKLHGDLIDRKQFLEILSHEMVHQWEQQTIGRMTHGKNFFTWKNKLKTLGIDLQKEY